MDNEHLTYEQQQSYYDTKWLNCINRKRGLDDVCRLEFIVSSVAKINSESTDRLKIIDLGCGCGWITDALSKYGEIVGVDLSINAAEKSYPGLRFIQANIVTDEIKGNYDIVVSSEVIEHLSSEDQRIYVRKAYDLLNEPGYMVLTTPNKPKAEDLFREFPAIRENLQPIENWLDKDSLSLLLSPYFEIAYIGSTAFHPIFIRKRRRLDLIYALSNDYPKLYKLINRLLRSSVQGLYLTLVARKRIAFPGSNQNT